MLYNFLIFFPPALMFIITGFLLIHFICSSCRKSIVMLQRSLLTILLSSLLAGLLFRNLVPNYPLFRSAQHYYPTPDHGINLVEHLAYRSGLSAYVVMILLFTLVFSGILFACLSSVVAIRAAKYSDTEQKCRTRWVIISKFIIVALPCIFYFSNNCLKPRDYQQVITLQNGASESLAVDNMNQAVDELDRRVSFKAKQEIQACPVEYLGTYHKWLILWICENWLGTDSVLHQKFRENGIWRTEDMAFAVLKSFQSEMNDEAECEQRELSIQVSLRDAPAEALRWWHVRKVLNTFAELGHCRVEIDDFVWDSSWIDGAKVYTYGDPLALGEDSNKVMCEWAERNQGRLVELWIGDNVEFDRIKIVTECLRDHGSSYILCFLKEDSRGLILDLYGSIQRKENEEPK